MATSTTRVAAPIPASAAQVYAILSDYEVGHPAILPKAAFAGLDVVEGGIGAGTVIDVRLKRARGHEVLRLRVTEPEPGRVLEESAADGTVTRFLVEPRGDAACQVTIETRWPKRGLLRDLMAGMVYRKELRNLAAYAASRGRQLSALASP